MKLTITAKELEARGLLNKFLNGRGWDLEWASHRGNFVWYLITDYAFGKLKEKDRIYFPTVLEEAEIELGETEIKSLGLLSREIFHAEIPLKDFGPLSLVDGEDC